jgi:hypothetical protein
LQPPVVPCTITFRSPVSWSKNRRLKLPYSPICHGAYLKRGNGFPESDFYVTRSWSGGLSSPDQDEKEYTTMQSKNKRSGSE